MRSQTTGTLTARQVSVAVGCALVLTVGVGSVPFINGASAYIAGGLDTTLVAYSFGPTVKSACGFLVSLIAARLIGLLGPRRCLLAGVFLSALAIVCCALASDLATWYAGNALFGIMAAIGSTAAATGVLNEHFGRRTPVVLGIIMGVMGLAVSLLMLAESWLLARFDYRIVLDGYAIAVLAIGAFAVLALIGRPTATDCTASEGGASAATCNQDDDGLTLQEALRTPAFYLFCLAMVCAAFPTNSFSAYAHMFLVAGGTEPAAATSVLGVFVFAGAIANLASGTVVKKLGTTRTAAVMFGGFALGIACLVAGAVTGQHVLLPAGVVLCAAIGPSGILPGLLIPQLFGRRDYASISAVGMGMFYLGAACSFFISALAIEGLGFNAGFCLLAAIGLLGLALFAAASRLARRPRASRP